jgi:hypothetical protein
MDEAERLLWNYANAIRNVCEAEHDPACEHNFGRAMKELDEAVKELAPVLPVNRVARVAAK